MANCLNSHELVLRTFKQNVVPSYEALQVGTTPTPFCEANRKRSQELLSLAWSVCMATFFISKNTRATRSLHYVQTFAIMMNCCGLSPDKQLLTDGQEDTLMKWTALSWWNEDSSTWGHAQMKRSRCVRAASINTGVPNHAALVTYRIYTSAGKLLWFSSWPRELQASPILFIQRDELMFKPRVVSRGRARRHLHVCRSTPAWSVRRLWKEPRVLGLKTMLVLRRETVTGNGKHLCRGE